MLPYRQKLQEIKTRARRLRNNQTESEKKFWEKIRKRQINNLKFLRQYPIIFNISSKVNYFIADFYCHEKKLIIEIDGGVHLKQKSYDEMRKETLKEMGFGIIRFTNEEILNNLESVLEKIYNL
ncbi:MAG: endonuclease domain-containing protein [Candidatus Magasanikbacteria bacterium]